MAKNFINSKIYTNGPFMASVEVSFPIVFAYMTHFLHLQGNLVYYRTRLFNSLAFIFLYTWTRAVWTSLHGCGLKRKFQPSYLSLPPEEMADWRGGGDGTDYKIIREVYDHEDALEEFEYELDSALEAGIRTIIIEPTKLGEETARWIKLGNIIRYTSVFTGVGSIVSGLVWPEQGVVFIPLGAASIIFSAVHILSWETDPCSKYRVTNEPPKSALRNLTTSRPVILVKKGVVLQRFLHTISMAAGAFCGSKIHKWYFQ